MILFELALYDDVIYLRRDCFNFVEYLRCHAGEGWSHVSEPFYHPFETICSEEGDEAFFPHHPDSSKSDGSPKNNRGVIGARIRLLNRRGCLFLVVENRPLRRLCLVSWNQHTFSTFHFSFWLTQHLIAMLGIWLVRWPPHLEGIGPPLWLLVFILQTFCGAFVWPAGVFVYVKDVLDDWSIKDVLDDWSVHPSEVFSGPSKDVAVVV
jgi:hypothetical protein